MKPLLKLGQGWVIIWHRNYGCDYSILTALVQLIHVSKLGDGIKCAHPHIHMCVCKIVSTNTIMNGNPRCLKYFCILISFSGKGDKIKWIHVLLRQQSFSRLLITVFQIITHWNWPCYNENKLCYYLQNSKVLPKYYGVYCIWLVYLRVTKSSCKVVCLTPRNLKPLANPVTTADALGLPVEHVRR